MAETVTKIGLYTSESLVKNTGKSWDQWIAILDKAGARSLKHGEIAAFLKKKYKLKAWWNQGIASGYAVAIGRREEGQNSKGEYIVTVTRTIKLPSKKVWKFMISDDGLKLWLKPINDFTLKPKMQFEAEGEVFGEVRTMKAGVRARLTYHDLDWEKPSIVQLYLGEQKSGSTIIVFSHEKLTSARLREQMRNVWSERLTDLKSALEVLQPKRSVKP